MDVSVFLCFQKHSQANSYKVSLIIPKSSHRIVYDKTPGQLQIHNFIDDVSIFHSSVTEVKQQKNFDVILGMDIIATGSLYISGDIYSFCI